MHHFGPADMAETVVCGSSFSVDKSKAKWQEYDANEYSPVHLSLSVMQALLDREFSGTSLE